VSRKQISREVIQIYKVGFAYCLSETQRIISNIKSENDFTSVDTLKQDVQREKQTVKHFVAQNKFWKQ